MTKNTRPKLYQFISPDKEGKIKTQKMLNITDLYPCLMIYWIAYNILNTYIPKYFTEIVSAMLSVVMYSLLLIISSISVYRIKLKIQRKRHEDFLLEPSQIAALFALTFLINAIYFFALYIFEQDSSMLIMTITNITLYIGFAVSLEELFNIKSIWDIGKCFLSPFTRSGFTKSDWWKFGLIIILIVLSAFISVYNTLVFVLLVAGFLAFFIVLSKIRKRALRLFCENITPILKDESVLVWQKGNINIVSKAIKHILLDLNIPFEPLYSENDVSTQEYNTIIILNSMNNKNDDMTHIEYLNKWSMKETVIIDPFMSKQMKKKNICSWLSIPNTKPLQFTLNHYLTALHIEKKTDCDKKL